jgi:ABC-2 type transport system ATP-binding protein
MGEDYVIEARQVRKSFGDVDVLKGLDLQVRRGTMFALLGPNGAGKSTMVRILATLLRPDAGTVRIDGFDVLDQAAAVRDRIGLTSQEAAVDGRLSGRENLVMMGRLFHLARPVARERAAELLGLFDLEDAADRPVRTYSGGMRRRLDLAVSLITSPAVLFLDEPTTGLDPRSRQLMWETIRGLLAHGTTILLTTQYLEEADQLADRIAVIDDGRIVAEGTGDELKRQVGTERLALEFADAGQAGKAVDAIGGVSAGETAVSVPVEDAADVRRLLNTVADAGLEVTALSMSRPTLDDVFLQLTARQTGEER